MSEVEPVEILDDAAGAVPADAELRDPVVLEEHGDLWAADPLAERARRAAAAPDAQLAGLAGNGLVDTDLGEVPREWLDPQTLPLAGRAQAAADAGLPLLDTDDDGVTDAGELIDGTDPLDPADARTRGWADEAGLAVGGYPDVSPPDIVA